MTPTVVHVADPGRPYDVVIGTGLLDQLPALLGEEVRRVAVLSPRALGGAVTAVHDSLVEAGFAVEPVEVPDGEDAKTLTVAGDCWSRLGRAGFTRTDAVVGFGGGAVTDLAGFVAACWLRGVRVVHIPTTLAGMVDAAVGGKTAVNTGEGKNLVGAFYPPAGVLCDLATMATLPPADYRSGLAEVVKCGFIADPVILDLIEADTGAAATPGADVARALVERAVRVKADVVAVDPTEQETPAADGVGRAALNYGHTFGHAIEKVEQYRWRHGDAVSVGLVYAAELGRLTGHLDAGTAARHGAVLRALSLPTTFRAGTWGTLRDAMRVDKKSRGARLRFVVLEGIGRPTLLADPPDDLLAAAYVTVSADAP